MSSSRRHLAVVQPESPVNEPDGGAASARTKSDLIPPQGANSGGELLKVGELAKRTGKTVRALHLYESLGLLTPAERSKGKYRLYSDDALVRVRWIVKLQSIGYSLPQIQEIAEAHRSAPSAKDAALGLAKTYQSKLDEVHVKLAELRRLERELSQSLHYLDACQSACDDSADPEACPSCGHHLDAPRTPTLVAGAHHQN